MHAFDGRTGGQTEFSSLYRDYIPCSAVKILAYSLNYCIVVSGAFKVRRRMVS